MDKESLPAFEIYFSGSGLVQVSNEVRMMILSELRKKEASLTELSRATGKAQSTLSVHLEKMVNEGLISVHEDPKDNRRKFYRLDSILIANAQESDEVCRKLAVEALAGVGDDPVETRDAVLRFLYYIMEAMGVTMSPLATLVGKVHAMAVKDKIRAESLEQTLMNAKDHLTSIRFGDVNIYSMNPFTVVVKDTFRCNPSAHMVPLWLYAVGFFQGVLDEHTGRRHELMSSEIYGTDEFFFKFTLRPVSD